MLPVSSRTRTLLIALIAIAILLPSAAASGLADPGARKSAYATKAALVRAKIARRITQAERERAAEQLKAMARARGLRTTSMPMPEPGDPPDYFGMTPNWAYSPPLRKFVDTLPGVGPENANNLGQYLSVAHPDTITYPGSDYYEIELREYTEQLHSDLPPTKLRGYVQVNKGTDANGRNTIEPDPIHYLGPTIFARKDRPVRIKFTNKLPTGSGGDLFIPVDTTYMGAGYGPLGMMPGDPMYTQNRGVIHLHGGKTVWISDGTAHQWITPADEDTPYPRGVSVRNVPDMPDPGDGSVTLFYSNQQSARMLWYHDHAYGITRLNVLAGEAAAYFLTDDTEQRLVSEGLIPEEQIPLVVQDKTFVDASTIATTDPTWAWGSMPGMAHTGDLWFPHVYMPAQNPAMPDGVNPMGRWHYGPWFWPPTTNIPHPPVPNPYYDPVNAPWEYELMPGTPYVSSGMEAFNDTPLVNGTAYPVLEIDPKAYRFRVLNAASDRFWNLQLYVADPGTISCDGRRRTEVKMVPAQPTAGWPADWPTDGREGGVPDPKTAGPDWIQIGTEGGFLPKVAVVPQQPITWVTDVTLFNAGNVDKHSLLLGPAERADVIVDFSKYAGKTLILYNDAPAAFPAGDPRYDYYTGAPDLRDTGGHDTPRVGFGPNTRTIMQIKVKPTQPAAPFDLAALQDAFTHTDAHPSVFEESQNKIIVPDARYDSTYGKSFPRDQFVRIYQTSHRFQNLDGVVTTFPLEPKAIQDEQGETFDEYGRMQGKLGLERPTGVPGAPNFILYGYLDPPTEIEQAVETSMVPLTPVFGDGTQIWKITHNGVDTHPMHFHLYDVQVINRVGWDGFIRYPDDNELGWKDTVRVSPLEDTIVALRPTVPVAPFNVPNSRRPLDPTQPLGGTMGFSTVDPVTGQPHTTPVVNEVRDFAWEYVWHCHILSHEEMDMMRPVTVAVRSDLPAAPTLESTSAVSPGAVRLAWTDGTPKESAATWGNPANEIGFRVERASLDASGDPGPFASVGEALANQTVFDDASIALGNRYAYRVVAYNEAGESTSSVLLAGPIEDDTPPLTSSNAGGGWRRGVFEASLSATDTLSGVASTWLAVDGGPPAAYTAPVAVSGEGTHTLEFWSVDASGNVEPTRTAQVLIDDTPPTTGDDRQSSYAGAAVIALIPSDALSGVASTWWRLDGGVVQSGRFVTTSELGTHVLEFGSTDAAGNAEATRTASFSVRPGPTTYAELAGPRRVQTALAVSRSVFATGSVDTVVVASAFAWPDAIVGSGLAGVHESPVLLTAPSGLSAGIADEIRRLGAAHAVIVGGPAAVGERVARDLEGVLGAGSVRRVGGVDRYETARLVAKEMASFYGCAWDGTAVLATGRDFPDALAVAPLSAAKGLPVFLAGGSGVARADVEAMRDIGVRRILIIGGPGAVSAGTASSVATTLGVGATRLAGADRYQTAVAVATYGVSSYGLSWDGLAIASGEDFPDAVSAGAAQGHPRSVLLLTPRAVLRSSVAAALAAHKDEVRTARFIGGTGAVSSAVRSAVRNVLN
ncbi:MAG: cell wall-binding repeat-containing protein [Coriobacteriia bacterium]|nr:cell wall-binding repeat-containing protein [Coriobacteriia bacterium]